MSIFSRTNRSFLGQWWWTVDRPMLGAFLILAIFGVVLVTTASPPVAEHLDLKSFYFLKHHIFILVPALVLLFGVSMLERRYVWRLSSLIFIGAIIALILVLFNGSEVKGAQRWIRIFGFSLQPGEFVKPSFLIVAAWVMALQKTRKGTPGNVIAAALYCLVITLLLLQPDFGMTVVITCSLAVQIFLAGLPFRFLGIFGFAGIAGIIGAYFTFDHVSSRIDRFFNPASGDTFQVDRALEAFKNGGLLGTGPGQGTVKLKLPDAHADFIFSVAGEEFGLWFVIVILFVFGFIILRGFNRLMDSGDIFVLLAAGGLLSMFGLQAFVHMSSSLHVLPAKGMTLPFISYGGSSLLSMGYAMGAVLALTRRQVRSGVSKGGLSLFSKEEKTKRI